MVIELQLVRAQCTVVLLHVIYFSKYIFYNIILKYTTKNLILLSNCIFGDGIL